MARYIMAIDAGRCMNCKVCIVACQQRNQVPYGYSRNWVLETRDEQVPGFMSYQPGACMHCGNPVCVDICPTSATYKTDDGSVVIDKDRCIGCGGCIAACPYGARFRHPYTGMADKCDYCREFSSGQQPACVAACATRARTFGDADNPDDPVSKVLAASKQLHVVAGKVDTKPGMTYLNYVKPETFPVLEGKSDMPGPLVAMSTVATGVRLLGGLSFFGVIGVFLKQLAWPSNGKSTELAPEAASGNGSEPISDEAARPGQSSVDVADAHEQPGNQAMIKRHSSTAIAMHWFNAACWLFLLFSGFAILANDNTQPIGNWWVNLWEGMFGGASVLLNAHISIGILWAVVYAIYIVLRARAEVWPFLREITNLNLKSDLLWCFKKGMWLVTDSKTMRRLGVDPELPPQGFYNAGQKLVALLAVLASIALVVSGALMLFYSGQAGTEALIQWSLLVHLCSAGIMAIFIPVHVYMAALAPGEGPALRSMFTGVVPEPFVRHHNPLWYEEIKKNR